MTARWRNDIVVGHFVRSDTGHMMQAIDVTRHSRITQQLVPSTTIFSFVCCSRFACKKWLLMTFGTSLVYVCTYVCMYIYIYIYICAYICIYVCTHICMYVYMYVCMCVCMYLYIYSCMYMYIYVCVYVCVYVCMHACML